MWRSGYLMCPRCGTTYYANMIQIQPNSGFGKTFQYYCPNYDCDGDELFTIDELMIPAVSKLNQLGYRTTYCCSGHQRRKPDDKADRYGYIMFAHGVYNVNTHPEGWELEANGTDTQVYNVVLRSKEPSLAKSIENLEKWVDTLQPLKKEDK